MADVMPNYFVEQQRLVAQIFTLRSTYQRQKLEVMEMADRKVRLEENMASTTGSIAETKRKLDDLIKTHGKAEGLEEEVG